MKKEFTFLMAALMLLTMMVLPGKAVGQIRTEEVAYTLDGTQTGGTNGYATESEITQNSITWKVNGNTTTNPWRIGGKNLSNEDRPLYSTSTITEDITKVVVTNGTATITVNSMTLIVSANSDFSNPTSTVSGSWAASETTTFERPTNADWSGKYFMLVYNVSAGNDNKYAQFTKAEFYYDNSGGGGSSAVATTTTIDASGITNTNVYSGTAAGTLSASVTYDNSGTSTAVPEASVTWSGDDDDVAIIDEDTGEVTLVGAGTVTFTATYAGNDDYSTSSDTYELTVINEDPSLVTIWSENFSSYSADDVPNGGTYSYACTNGGGTTKIYTNASTGGESPELLVGKSNGTFTAIIPLLNSTYGYDGDLTLKYKTNAKSLNVKTTTSDINIEGESSSGAGITYNTYGEHTITFKGVTISTENITIVFTTTSGDNVRLDDIVLKGKQAALTKVATPTISPASGAVVSGTEVTMTCGTAGATIYYTTDGATPSSNSTAYNPASKPTITSVCTIKAIGIKDGLTDSDVASASYTLASPCATPTFLPVAGEVESGTEVTITCATEGASIYYTMGANPADPTSSSTLYNSSSKPTITTATTIKAIAVKDGNANSEVASAAYNIIDYASLTEDFTYDGNGKNDLPTGLTAYNLGSGYASSPKMQFENKNSNISSLILKLGEAPISISYDIKGNSFSGGTFKVQLSEDGSNYEDLAVYSTLGDKQSVTHICNNSDVRYIKWIYTNKSSGNVALGNIKVTNSANFNNLTIESGSTYTVENGAILTLTGTVTNNGTLIIEEGGQIILPEDASVSATIKRSVKGNAKAAEWEAFASTINNLAIGSTNLITGTYDLYMYDEAATGAEWRNYKANPGAFANLANSRGYLYRNAATMDITITGSLNTSDISTYTLSRNSEDANIIGFNFVGNPYQMEIYKGVAISNDYLETGYYVLENGGWVVKDDDVVIAPGAGILVQAINGGHNKALEITYTGASAKANHDNIMFSVKNSEYSDVAYAMFDKGHGLNKIEHRNANIPMLYIPQNGERFAIAMMDDNTQMFDLSFKAMTTGKYTISMNAKGNFSYVHLIDRLTGDDTNLLIEDYSFIGSPQDNAERFIVKLSYDNDSSTGSETFAYQSGNEIIVNGEGTLEVYDVTGRKVMNTTINGVQTVTGLNNGFYIFRLNEKTQKIVVR